MNTATRAAGGAGTATTGEPDDQDAAATEAADTAIGIVGVVGLGAMGEGLLRTLSDAGLDVIGVDTDPDALARVGQRLKTQQPPAREPRTLVLTSELTALARADLVIEALPDRIGTKAEVLRRIDEVCPPDTIVATSSSTLPVQHLAVLSGRPGRTVGLRCFVPPPVGETVDVTGTAATAEGTVAKVRALLSRTHRDRPPVTVSAGARDAADELVLGLFNRAAALHSQGYADRVQIDTAMTLGCALPVGPLRMLDLMGLDRAAERLGELARSTGDDALRPAPALAALIAEGRLGRRTGHGFYRYDEAGEPVAGEERAPVSGTPREIRRIGVVGAGLMAKGIAELTARAGIPTVIAGRHAGRAAEAVAGIRTSLDRSVRRGRLAPESREDALGLITASGSLTDFAECDLVVEAVAEDIAVKRAVFTRLDSVVRPDALLATATSSLSVADCAAATSRPDRFVGLHFFNPAPVMRLVELGRTPDTGADTLATAHMLCERLGKTPVELGDRAGYVVNYLLLPYLNSAMRMLESRDLSLAEVDAAVERGFGYPMGPFALLDTIGLDVSLAIQQRLHEEFDEPSLAPATLLEQLVDLGHLGRKTGMGLRAY
ncbi:3-hydroxyacyl-CoA dehydrogenase family protein [Streptomyces violaceoruber]|uniref:3-hydroxyacyl-CoA dehydrogenase family protein n=1 Tax=Streptomyces violaceoruber TaxID=1935 RepID=UPI003B42EC48